MKQEIIIEFFFGEGGWWDFSRCIITLLKSGRVLIDVSGQARQEPRRDQGKHFREALLLTIFLNFLERCVHSGVLYISERRQGPQTSRGRPGVAYPFYPLSTGLGWNWKLTPLTRRVDMYFKTIEVAKKVG